MTKHRLVRAVIASILFLVVVAQTPASPAQGTAAGAATPAPVPSSGCGVSHQGPVTEEKRFLDVNGTERWFLVTVPSAHDGNKPLPLVIDFHGLAEGAVIHALTSAFSPVAEREGFVVAFPQGQFDPVRWNSSPGTTFMGDPNDDLMFVDEIIDGLGQDLCLDRTRVYASGYSWGAFTTSLLACARSNRFAAIAPVAGLRLLNPCPEERPVPIITFHGTDDTWVNFNGGFGPIPFMANKPSTPASLAPAAADLNGPGIPANVAGMAAINGCDPTPTDIPISAEVIRRVYDCPAGADVEFYIVLGGGHAWPGSEFSRAIAAAIGYTTFDINATELAWSFFQQFQLPCPEDATCGTPETPDPPTTAPTSTTTPTPTIAPAPASVAPVSTAAVHPSFTG
jgi:polyhydroxybutyrate depolymerase